MNNTPLTDEEVNARFSRIAADVREDEILTEWGQRHGRTNGVELDFVVLKVLVVGAVLLLIFLGQHLTLEQKCYVIFAIAGAGFAGILAFVFRRFKAGFAIKVLAIGLALAGITTVLWQHLLHIIVG